MNRLGRDDGMSIDTKALKERIYALEADLDTAQHADHGETIRTLVVAADRLAALEAENDRMKRDVDEEALAQEDHNG